MPRNRLLPLVFCLAAGSLAAGPIAFVTCQNGDALSVLDIDAGTELRRLSVPGRPAGVAAAPDGSVYTVSTDSKTVRHLSPMGEVLAETVLDGGPIGVALDPRAARLFVSDWYNARIWVLDAPSLGLLTTLETGSAPAGLAVSGGFLASADRDANAVSIFDRETLALRHRVPVGERPFGIAFAPDGRLFAANVGTNDVSVIDPATGTVTGRFPVGDRPYGVAFARDRVFVTNQYADTVSVVDGQSLAPLATLSVGEYPEGIDSDGHRVVVSNWASNTVTLIDAATLTVTGEIATADGPRAFGRFLGGAAP